MKHTFKRFLTTPFVCLVLIISMLALPMNASAEGGTLGKETPKLTCVFTDAKGKAANGNMLKAGTYKVDIVLSGMKAVSIIELTATYKEPISSVTYLSCYGTNHEDMNESGHKVDSTTVSVMQVAEGDDTCAIDTNGTVMVSLSVTVTSSCDFAEVFEFSPDPQLCFVQASYLDGKEKGYVLQPSLADGMYKLQADASPEFIITEFDVTGSVTIARDYQGAASSAPVKGITVSIEGKPEKTVVTDADGAYTLTELSEGEYTLVFSGANTIDRKVKLVVSRDKADDYGQRNVAEIGICVLDYNQDGKINSTDIARYSMQKIDLNGDGQIDKEDYDIFRSFLRKTVAYTQMEL